MTSGAVFAVFFFLGLSSTMAQAIMIREGLTVFFGNELIIGSLLGSWLLSIAVGARLGSAVAAARRRPLYPFLTAVIAAFVLLPLQVAALRLTRVFLDISPGQHVPFAPTVITAVVCLAPFALMIGFTFPIGCRLAAEAHPRGPRIIGTIYMVEALGAAVGGLLFTFLLLGRVGTFALLAGLLGIVLLSVSISLPVGRRSAVRIAYCLIALLLTAGLLRLYGLVDSYSRTIRWRSLAGDLRLVDSADSRYQHLDLSRQADQYGVHGNGLFYFPVPDPYRYAALANYVLAQHPAPDSVLIVGGSGGGLISTLLQSRVKRIDSVRLDPGIDRLIEQVLPADYRRAAGDPRTEVIYGDGRAYVARTDRRYDIVFLNLPDPSSAVINRYYTAEFFRQAQHVLKPGGVLGLNLSGAENYLTEEIADYGASVYHTLRSVFPHVLVTSGETWFMFASESGRSISHNPEILADRYEKHGARSRYFSPYLFEMILQPARLEFIRAILENKTDIRLNHDLQPVTYFFNLLLWDRYSGETRSDRSFIGSVFRWLSSVSTFWFLTGLVVLLLMRFGYLTVARPYRNRQYRFNAVLAIAVCGFTAMGLEIILLYGFQNLFGSLYRMVALVVAAFMLGLSAGSWILTRYLDRIRRPVPVFILIQSLTALLALTLPRLLGGFASEVAGGVGGNAAVTFYLLLLVISGFLTGTGFPLAGRIHVEAGGRIGTTAGMIDTADHAGAFLGAFLTGTLIIPVFGAAAGGRLIAALNLACIALWLQLMTDRRRSKV